MSDEVFAKMTDRYARKETPWDHPLPPPEVQAFVAEHPAGRALDIGCGYGRAAIYLAQQGWDVDGVDIVEMAIAEAKVRGGAAGVSARFTCHSVTDLSFLDGVYDYAIDVGCAHSLTATQWVLHHAELRRLLRPNGIYMLYGRLLGPKDWGINNAHLLPLMTDGFDLLRHEPGMTYMDDGSSWASAWYWFQRKDG